MHRVRSCVPLVNTSHHSLTLSCCPSQVGGGETRRPAQKLWTACARAVVECLCDSCCPPVPYFSWRKKHAAPLPHCAREFIVITKSSSKKRSCCSRRRCLAGCQSSCRSAMATVYTDKPANTWKRSALFSYRRKLASVRYQSLSSRRSTEAPSAVSAHVQDWSLLVEVDHRYVALSRA